LVVDERYNPNRAVSSPLKRELVTPCFKKPVRLFFRSSKHVLSRSASLFDIPCKISCLSKACLAFRTRLPKEKYKYKRLTDMRAKYGKDIINEAIVDSICTSLILLYEEKRQVILLPLLFFLVFFFQSFLRFFFLFRRLGLRQIWTIAFARPCLHFLAYRLGL
jgi:hypothetical protein